MSLSVILSSPYQALTCIVSADLAKKNPANKVLCNKSKILVVMICNAAASQQH